MSVYKNQFMMDESVTDDGGYGGVSGVMNRPNFTYLLIFVLWECKLRMIVINSSRRNIYFKQELCLQSLPGYPCKRNLNGGSTGSDVACFYKETLTKLTEGNNSCYGSCGGSLFWVHEDALLKLPGLN